MPWQPPDHWTEIQSQLKKTGQVKLDASGNGVLYFTPDSARQRWQVSSVIVTTSQAANATVVPQATVALNTNDLGTMSQGNNRGASWSGNQDTFQGNIDVGPCDNLTVLFNPAPGSTAGQIAQLVGVIASVVVLGDKFTRRA
jgi:hypothetical protein